MVQIVLTSTATSVCKGLEGNVNPKVLFTSWHTLDVMLFVLERLADHLKACFKENCSDTRHNNSRCTPWALHLRDEHSGQALPYLLVFAIEKHVQLRKLKEALWKRRLLSPFHLPLLLWFLPSLFKDCSNCYIWFHIFIFTLGVHLYFPFPSFFAFAFFLIRSYFLITAYVFPSLNLNHFYAPFWDLFWNYDDRVDPLAGNFLLFPCLVSFKFVVRVVIVSLHILEQDFCR